jgi:hypothetical protein
METVDETNYATLGITINTAMLRAGKKSPPSRNQPLSIPWGDKLIQTVDVISVPEAGVVRGELLAISGDPEQGFDIKVDGWLRLANGEKVTLLRTWNDPRYEPVVVYPFHSEDGFLRTWNVYKMRYPRGRVVEERWTGNGGFWVETVSDRERIYHCSHGAASPPDFESLVFKITINP